MGPLWHVVSSLITTREGACVGKFSKYSHLGGSLFSLPRLFWARKNYNIGTVLPHIPCDLHSKIGGISMPLSGVPYSSKSKIV